MFPSSERIPLLQRLKRSVVVADGAMGTLAASLSAHAVESVESLTLSNPDLISDIHRQYVRAGAQIIETNTFGANRLELARYNLDNKTVELNRVAVRLARAQAPPEVYVAGSIGPCHFSADPDQSQSRFIDFEEALREQLQALLDEGIDLIFFETFSETSELSAAVGLARKLTTLPVAASLVAGRFGTSASGEDLALSAQRLIDSGADIIGLNCGYGIRAIEGAMEYINHLGVPLSVMPNAGFPERIGGRLRFGASEEYLANEALVLAQKGARIIGGCCGTTPAHIEAMARRLSERKIVLKVRTRREITPVQTDTSFKDGALLASFSSVKVPVICEIDPPATLNVRRNLSAIEAAAAAGASAISMADNPLATIRIENLSFAACVRNTVKIPVVLHVTGRDRNLLGLQSFMLGAHLQGIEGLLCVTGDPSTHHGGGTNVFDANSIGLLKMAANLNRGHNLLGKELGMQTDFSLGAAVNPSVADFSPQVRHLRNKVAAGARFALTQPLYEQHKAREFLEACRGLGIKIFVGILPVLSSRTAEYLHHEVPGISIPQELRTALAQKNDPLYQKETGLDHAMQLVSDLCAVVDGFYVIAPHTQPSIAADLTAFIRKTARTINS
jgi:homocysteine S-methyltransferase